MVRKQFRAAHGDGVTKVLHVYTDTKNEQHIFVREVLDTCMSGRDRWPATPNFNKSVGFVNGDIYRISDVDGYERGVNNHVKWEDHLISMPSYVKRAQRKSLLIAPADLLNMLLVGKNAFFGLGMSVYNYVMLVCILNAMTEDQPQNNRAELELFCIYCAENGIDVDQMVHSFKESNLRYAGPPPQILHPAPEPKHVLVVDEEEGEIRSHPYSDKGKEEEEDAPLEDVSSKRKRSPVSVETSAKKQTRFAAQYILSHSKDEMVCFMAQSILDNT